MPPQSAAKTLSYGSFIGGPVGFIMALVAAGTFVKGVSLMGIFLTCFALFAFIWRSWEINAESGSLTVRRSLLWISFSRRRYSLDKVDRIIVEPAGEGFIRFGNMHGQMVSVTCDGDRITLAQIRSAADLKTMLRSLREVLPRRVRVERKRVYVFGRD
jgi:hypothetical protein